MKIKIGIRREDINKWERRVPLIPSHAKELVEHYPLEILVQPSEIRVFTDDDYRAMGISVEENICPSSIILALKEIPIDKLEAGKTYVFFSHTIKGQSHNMPMLKRMMELGCSLIDYEKMVDDKGRRVLYFGNYAGHAGMVNTLWALGRRLAGEGLKSPFSELHPTHHYRSLVEVREAVGKVAVKIGREGLPEELGPAVFAFFGYGHVSEGAQEIFDILPVERVAPRDIPKLFETKRPSRHVLYKSVFKEEDMVEPVEAGRTFDLQDYYHRPAGYRAVVEPYLPYLTAIVNGIFWTPDYPRFVTKSALRSLFGGAEKPRLRVIGDITCDIDGSIESTVMATDDDNPVYVYDPLQDRAALGFEGRGPVVMAVYNLPAELPLESSTYFSGKLKSHVPALAAADFRSTFADSGLTDVLRRAVILYRGQLTPDFAYLSRFIA